MKRMSLTGLALAALAAGPVLAQMPTAVNQLAIPADPSPAGQRAAQQVETKLEEVIRQLETERGKLDRLREAYKPDAPRVQEQQVVIAKLFLERDALQGELQDVIAHDRQNQPAVLLSRTVSVSFNDTSVPQALEALQKSSRVTMVLDAAVDASQRLA